VSQDRFVHQIGAPITRVLLSPRCRQSAFSRSLYARLYLLGKGLTERREVRFLRAQVKPGMVVFDVGANLGFYTALFSELAGPAGQVHAFEPDPLSFGILKRRTGRRHNVELNPVAVSDHPGRAPLFCNPSNRADNRLYTSHAGEAAEAVEVPVMTLDDYCAQRGIGRIDAVKMDVQGTEIAALRGFRRTLLAARPRWMLIEFSPGHLRGAGADPAAFWAILGELGFEPWRLDGREPFPIADTAAFTREHERGYTDIWARRPEGRGVLE
jgi:FkbM family methyltransferase